MRTFILGPCALESEDQVDSLISFCKAWKFRYVRAQIFKPRTHPRSFQGLGENGLPLVQKMRQQGLLPVMEACSVEHLDPVLQVAEVLQIGARNMQNFELLKQVGKHPLYKTNPRPVMLKRGFSNNLEEWLNSALYLEESGVPQDKIILCERGTRNHAAPAGVTLDLGMALKARQKSPYSVILDPSHGTRDASLVLPMTRALMALPLDGIMLEVHPVPQESVSDAQQAISFEDMDKFLKSFENPDLIPRYESNAHVRIQY